MVWLEQYGGPLRSNAGQLRGERQFGGSISDCHTKAFPSIRDFQQQVDQ